MTELLSCPFCGEPAEDFNPDGGQEGYSIRCSSPPQWFEGKLEACPMSTFSYTKYEDAIAAWNRRVPAVVKPPIVE